MGELQMLQLITDYNPSRHDNQIVRAGIIDFNDSILNYKSKSLSIFLKDADENIQGGVLTWLDIDSIYIDILWVEEKLRGQGYGTRLLLAAEEEGKKNGCGFCTLDTFGFQAEEFYLKNGYEHLGEIKNYIRHYSRIYLRKKLR